MNINEHTVYRNLKEMDSIVDCIYCTTYPLLPRFVNRLTAIEQICVIYLCDVIFTTN